MITTSVKHYNLMSINGVTVHKNHGSVRFKKNKYIWAEHFGFYFQGIYRDLIINILYLFKILKT